MSTWQTMESAPEGELVLCFCPGVNSGLDGCEVLMVFHGADDPVHASGRSYWTNGGPNGGSDFNFDAGEEPTHWMPLPPPPLRGESNARFIAGPHKETR
jgi:hypothetical protein